MKPIDLCTNRSVPQQSRLPRSLALHRVDVASHPCPTGSATRAGFNVWRHDCIHTQASFGGEHEAMGLVCVSWDLFYYLLQINDICFQMALLAHGPIKWDSGECLCIYSIDISYVFHGIVGQ